MMMMVLRHLQLIPSYMMNIRMFLIHLKLNNDNKLTWVSSSTSSSFHDFNSESSFICWWLILNTSNQLLLLLLPTIISSSYNINFSLIMFPAVFWWFSYQKIPHDDDDEKLGFGLKKKRDEEREDTLEERWDNIKWEDSDILTQGCLMEHHTHHHQEFTRWFCCRNRFFLFVASNPFMIPPLILLIKSSCWWWWWLLFEMISIRSFDPSSAQFSSLFSDFFWLLLMLIRFSNNLLFSPHHHDDFYWCLKIPWTFPDHFSFIRVLCYFMIFSFLFDFMLLKSPF